MNPSANVAKQLKAYKERNANHNAIKSRKDVDQFILKIKPLSVNEAYTGKRFKTPTYTAYAKEVGFTLPAMKIPDGKLEIHFTWGFSNSGADCDNPCKPMMDLLQKKYGFNDNRVYKIIQEKEVVKKGREFIKFEIRKYD